MRSTIIAAGSALTGGPDTSTSSQYPVQRRPLSPPTFGTGSTTQPGSNNYGKPSNDVS